MDLIFCEPFWKCNSILKCELNFRCRSCFWLIVVICLIRFMTDFYFIFLFLITKFITKKDKSHKGKGRRELQRVAVKYLGNKGSTVLIRPFGNMN